MGGWKDEALWRAVQNERRFLVTADKGFADARNYPPGAHEEYCYCGLRRTASARLWLCWKGCSSPIHSRH